MRSKWRTLMLFCVTSAMLLVSLDAHAARIPSLFSGDSGNTVMILQTKLQADGFYAYPEITGFYGEHTQQAVMDYQTSVGLYADGIAGDATLRALFGNTAEALYSGYVSTAGDEAVLKLSMRGTAVEKLQRRLRELRYLAGDTRATGYFGTLTESAVRLFQQVHQLDADGIVGPATIAALYSDNAICATDVDTTKYTAVTATVKAATSKGQQAVELARQHLGAKYVFGTSGPKTFDCSGLVMYVYDQLGVSLPHSAQSMGYGHGTKIEKSKLQVGDLVFFNTNAKDGDLCDHVGIYIGGGQFIHASSGSSKKVVISDLSSSYYTRTYSWARRVL